MRKGFLAVFSGFPDHHFLEEITKRLREELTVRKSIVFISACPLEYGQNDDDSDGMHEMFAEQGLAFDRHCVIDKRTEPCEAKELVENADCIFLMGGGACGEQLDLIREKGCYEALTDCRAAVFGVSTGSMNMARNTVDFFESMEPFPGLGFTNITVSCHHDPDDAWRYEQTLKMSETRVVYAMEDMSAFFIKGGKIDAVGNIYRAENRQLRLITEDDIRELEQDEFRRVFDTIPEQFDKYRPRYSAELFAFLNDRAQIGPGKSVLEIGPGTGQASDPVIGTGCDHIVIPEPIRSEFFRGLKDAVLEAGDRILFNDTYVLYLTKKPC